MHGSPLAQGVLGTALISNAVHVVSYFTQRVGVDGYRGNDIDAYEGSGGNPHRVCAALVVYSAWTLQRMRKNSIPIFYVNLHF